MPAGEASAILSQLSSSRLDLRRFEGLNGTPEEYYTALLRADALNLRDHPTVFARLAILESRGVAYAMQGASSLDRMASVLSNADNLVWSHPRKPQTPAYSVSIPMSNRPREGAGSGCPPTDAGGFTPEGGGRP